MTNDLAPDVTKSVRASDDIQTSGRWRALNEKIEGHANNPQTGSEWYIELFAALCYQVFSEYLLLKKAYTEKQSRDVPLLAWRARNLLELSVWAAYFGMSKENARRLFEDAGRDALDAVAALATWSANSLPSSEWSEPLQAERQDLQRRAANEGIENLEGAYKRVASAAADCGLREHFVFNNKLLSKFAHPTAMQILGKADEETNEFQRDYFLNQGCWFFVEAFAALEKVSFHP